MKKYGEKSERTAKVTVKQSIIPGGLMLFGMLISVQTVRADCGLSRLQNSTFNVPALVVSENTPVGTVVWNVSVGLMGWAINCRNAGADVRINNRGSATGLTIGNADVYSTNVQGIGYAFTYLINGEGENGPIRWPSTTHLNPIPDVGFGTVSTMKLSLVKTGKVKSGRLTPGLYGSWRYGGHQIGSYSLNINGPIVGTASCTVNQSAISVPMGNEVKVSSFTGQGSSAASTSFSIPLNCEANARIQVRLDGMAFGDTMPGVLSLNAMPDTAKGIGVQLLRAGAPVKFGVSTAIGTAPVDGSFSIDYTARYYQTSAVVTAGRANATATFTLTYQ